MTAVESKARMNFAPVSGAPSTLLRVAAGWFILNGATYGVFILLGIGAILRGNIEFVNSPVAFIRITVNALSAIGLVWTGILLGRGRRLGAYLASFFLLLPVLFAAWQPMSATEIFFLVLGLLVLAVVWRELK